MEKINFIPEDYKKITKDGSITWQSPSNIALIKYWGKHGDQMPKNPSISFTLNSCRTITELKFSRKEKPADTFDFKVFFDGKRTVGFESKIQTFFQRIEIYLPFLKEFRFEIHTSNTFPHSSGIASSASGMSALALCLMSMERDMNNEEMSDIFFNQKASFLARLGSGSACRSIEGDLVVWGEHKDIEGSSDLFSIKYPYEVHEVFKNYQDTILLVDKGEKQISSTAGHGLMNDHPFAENRFQQANQNITEIKRILKSGDMDAFIDLVESEALSLHSMMLTSTPRFILMKPNTLEIIDRIWKFRKGTSSPICFTLDAGANVHVLYPEKDKEQILEFIKKELVVYCQNGHYICDQICYGAKKM
jgi:diphosphomevalonate decarboxylase